MIFNSFQDREQLIRIKDKCGWNLVKFGDLFLDATSKASKIKKENYLINGKHCIVDQSKELIAGYINIDEGLFRHSTAVIVFGDHTKVIKYIDFPLFLGADGVKLLLPKSDVYVKYLYYFLKSVQIPDAGYNRHFKYLKETIIPLPPIDVQNKIADVLDKAQELIEIRKKQLEKLNELVQSVFFDMFGDPVKNEKEWEGAKLGFIGNWRSGGTPSRSKPEYFQGDIPWYSSGELERMYVEKSVECISREALEESAAKVIEPGSLLLGMYDTAALKSSVTTCECSCNQAIAFAKLNSKICNTIFVYYTIQFARDHYKRLQRGVRQQNMNLSMIRDIEIILPPIDLQNEFVQIVEKTEQQKSIMQQSLAEMENNFRSIMQRAFWGELF